VCGGGEDGGRGYILGVVYFSLGQSLNLPACPFANFYFGLMCFMNESWAAENCKQNMAAIYRFIGGKTVINLQAADKLHPTDTDTGTEIHSLNLNFFRGLRLNLFGFIIYLSLNSLYCHVSVSVAVSCRSTSISFCVLSFSLSVVLLVPMYSSCFIFCFRRFCSERAKKYLEDVRTLLLVTSICIFVSLCVAFWHVFRASAQLFTTRRSSEPAAF